VYRRSHPLFLILLASSVAACIGGGTPAAPAASVVALPSASSTATSSAPSAEAPVSPPASSAAESTPTAEPTPDAIETPSTEPRSSASAPAAAAVAGCTGTDANRTFFANAAARYDWPVYCAVLPARWFVEVGSFRSGKLDISYKGPGGAHFELHEGAICSAGTACAPAGTDTGTVGFGDQSATLIRADDGSLAAVVDRGQARSWLAIGQGMDEAAFSALLGALIRLD
jgi:hypothetical protein